MKLVVGLGNPGRKYAETRHNVGFEVVSALSRRWRIDMTRQRFQGAFGDGQIIDQRVALLAPMTYMNRSGGSVREAVSFFKLELEDLIVVVDDLALPLGRVRIRKRGSAGGHNGLTDVIAKLGDDGFCRLRLGIGSATGEQMVGHVLGKFEEDERPIIEQAIGRAATAVERWVGEGADAAMNEFNKPDDSGQ